MKNLSKICNYEDFEIISVVKKGEYTTSLVQDPFSGTRYIKKELSKEKLSIYQKLRELKHQGLAEIIEIIEKDNKIIVIIEYAVGETLKSILDNKIKLDERVATSYIQQLASILNVVHQNGIIHRDINPSNIIVAVNSQVKLIDFDIARFYKSSQTEDTQLLGTPGYAAPEQFGFNQSTASSDIYALGVLLNVMVTGMKPHEIQINNEGLALIVKNCTAMDQSVRYQDVMQLDYDLRRLRHTVQNYFPKKTSKKESSKKRKRKGKAIKRISLFIIISLSAFFAWRFFEGDNDESPISIENNSNAENSLTQEMLIGRWETGSGDALSCPLCNREDEIEFLENNTVILNDQFGVRNEIWLLDGANLRIANSEYNVEINGSIITISEDSSDRERMWIRDGDAPVANNAPISQIEDDFDDDHNLTQEMLIGRWETGSGDGLSCPLCNREDEIEFLENNTVILNDQFGVRNEIWQLSGTNLRIANSEYTVKITGDILTISDDSRDRSRERMWIRGR